MQKIIVAIPHSHAWLWLQTCVSSLLKYPPIAHGYEVEIVVVDNSPWSPAIRGITDTRLIERWNSPQTGIKKVIVETNTKANKFHASALDYVVDNFDFDLLMAWETDVLALRPMWLQWFVNQLKPTDFAVGHWHHEQFVNPSCTLYRGSVLRAMRTWCNKNPEPDVLRWGENFAKTAPLDNNMPAWAEEEKRNMISWVSGPFADKRGWPEGTTLKEGPSGQLKGPGWYEPGQMLHHWAVENGYTYKVCPTTTTQVQRENGIIPVQTMYNGGNGADPGRQLDYGELESMAETVHLWGGTRALDILKHEVTCNFVASNTPFWLEREARFWLASVPEDVQATTLDLIRQYGFHYKGAGTSEVTDRDRAAVAMVKECYAKGGVKI